MLRMRMRMWWPACALFSSLAVLSVCFPLQGQSEKVPTELLSYFRANVLLRTFAGHGDSLAAVVEVRLSETSLSANEVRVYRASLRGMTHGREILVAMAGTRLWLLGGTVAPDLVGVAAEMNLRLGHGNERDASVLELLARLGDGFAARNIRVARSSQSFPAGSLQTGAGMREVGPAGCIEVESGPDASVPPVTYSRWCFQSDTTGRIVAWDRAQFSLAEMSAFPDTGTHH